MWLELMIMSSGEPCTRKEKQIALTEWPKFPEFEEFPSAQSKDLAALILWCWGKGRK